MALAELTGITQFGSVPKLRTENLNIAFCPMQIEEIFTVLERFITVNPEVARSH